MIVDDDEVMRTLLRRILERMGFSQIDIAKDGAEGLELARSQCPDVIISDYDMPNMQGLQFLKAVREEPALAKTVFVMLSGSTNNMVRKRAGELGANSIIIKPVSPGDLKQKLADLVHELTGATIEWDPSTMSRRSGSDTSCMAGK